ncbi:glycosyltransferase [Candidatus Woesearchaeota archaeon]|nr:glycosyltransferase [Candidatus Woesearchaeota archaeon]
MNILIVDLAGCREPTLGFQIKSAFLELGYKVRSFNYRKWKLQHFPVTNLVLNKMIVNTAVKWPADFVLVNKGETLLPGTVTNISSRGITTVNWNPDEPFGKLQSFNKIRNIEEYDAFFTYDKQYVKELKEVNPHSYHLPPGADPNGVYKEQIPLKKRKYSADVCLVGTAYANRVELLKQLKKYQVKVAGPGWYKAPDRIAKRALPFVDIYQMVQLFNKSKIVLNPYGQSKHFIVPNPRTFEIPATRSFQLTDMPREVKHYFRPKKEIVVYNGKDEFKELVDYYLEHDEERVKIAQAGYERVIKEHTMKHRIQKLLGIVKRLE